MLGGPEKVGISRINDHPTFLEPLRVVLVKKHNRPCGPLMATGSWSTPRLFNPQSKLNMEKMTLSYQTNQSAE